MTDNAQDVRAGEAAVELPVQFDAGLYFIGRIHTPWTRRADCPKNPNEARERGLTCSIDVDSRWAIALTGLETCTHILVLYWMHEARRDLVIQTPRHYGGPRGTFALRSPVRPNPIAASVVQLLAIEGTRLRVLGLDCLDGTPLLDIKPHFGSVDGAPDSMMP